MIKNSTTQKLALASAITLAFISTQALAQTADGTLVISGQVSANTCKLNISDASPAAPTNMGVRSVELGTVAPPTGTIVAGTTFGTKQNITFSLTSSTGTGACTITGGTLNQWNLALDLQFGQVGTAASKAFLTNQASTNAASNVGVSLFDNSGTQFASILTGQGIQGTRLTNSTTGVAAGATLTLGAQFMTTSASAPTAGLFSSTVPLLLVYN